jgi:hypothetical protein
LRLSINFDERDSSVVPKITAVCDELGLEYTLEERNDWLTHALRPQSEDSTHVLFVVSQTTAVSWWLPFQIGRAVERRVGIVSYVWDSTNNLPKYLEAGDTVKGLEGLKSRLCRLVGART